jgi:hypothetical protein
LPEISQITQIQERKSPGGGKQHSVKSVVVRFLLEDEFSLKLPLPLDAFAPKVGARSELRACLRLILLVPVSLAG